MDDFIVLLYCWLIFKKKSFFPFFTMYCITVFITTCKIITVLIYYRTTETIVASVFIHAIWNAKMKKIRVDDRFD